MSRLPPMLGAIVPLLVVGAIASSRAVGAQALGALAGTVVHVDDGDTIDVRIADRVERVRYIGIDAPEVAHDARDGRGARRGDRGGAAAAGLNRALVAGTVVRLELDVERRDRYGRLLAYVWAGGGMVNA